MTSRIIEKSAAQGRLICSKPDDSDAVIAERLANYLLAGFGIRPPTLSIVGLNERPSEIVGKYHPRKGSLTFKGLTRTDATEWIVTAALAGHSVFRNNGGMGTIADIRERCKNLAKWGKL